MADPNATRNSTELAIIEEKTSVGHRIRWVAENSDALAALLLGVTALMIGTLATVSQDVLDNCILGTLSVLSFALLRDRFTRDSGERREKRVSDQVLGTLQPLRAVLPTIPDLDRSIERMHAAIDGLAAVQTLKGTEDLEQVFADSREHTSQWTFKGGTGTYTRAMTLPECVAKAQRSNPRRQLSVRLLILDPTDAGLCGLYADYRKTLTAQADGAEERWTTDRTQKESFATVLAAGWHKRSYDLLSVYVYLVSTMSTFRYDLSDSRIIITQDAPQFPAMIISNESPHYHAYATEISKTIQQARQVTIEGPHTKLADPLTEGQVRQYFIEAGVPPLPLSIRRDVPFWEIRFFDGDRVADVLGMAVAAFGGGPGRCPLASGPVARQPGDVAD